MHIADEIPDAEVLCSLEPEELGLRLLPMLATWGSPMIGGAMTFENLRNRVVGNPQLQAPGAYPAQHTSAVLQALLEAWMWLEGSAFLLPDPNYLSGGARTLSRKARNLATLPSAQRAMSVHRIRKESLHPSIREEVWSAYHRGRYDTAVFEAMKAVEIAVRAGAKANASDVGVKLMRKAFDVRTGPLTDMNADEAEREARGHLFAGAIGSYKNPQSHRRVDLSDADEAAEIVMLANHLLRIVDGAIVAKQGDADQS